MSKVWGIDPDSAGFPLAIYRDGELCELKTIDTVYLVFGFADPDQRPDLLVIEDVKANKGIYTRNDVGNRKVSQTISQRVGMCKQMQFVAQSVAGHYRVPIIAVRPTAGNWADDRERFELATGWAKQSNRDTRAACYFAYLHRHYKG